MKNNIFVKIFNHIEEALLSVTFVIMTLICFIQVITRYIFHYSMPWSEEVLRALFVWSSCLGISLGFRTKSHLGVDAVVILFCLVMIYYSAGITNHQFITNQKTIAVGMPIAYVSVSLVVGFTLTIIRIIQVMVETFTSKNKKDETHISEGLL